VQNYLIATFHDLLSPSSCSCIAELAHLRRRGFYRRKNRDFLLTLEQRTHVSGSRKAPINSPFYRNQAPFLLLPHLSLIHPYEHKCMKQKLCRRRKVLVNPLLSFPSDQLCLHFSNTPKQRSSSRQNWRDRHQIPTSRAMRILRQRLLMQHPLPQQ
jgi:hypothetical protein